MSEFAEVNSNVNSAWSEIDIYTAAQTIKNFGTGIFPSHWLEMAKSRLYDGDVAAAWTVHRIVRDLLSMFSPICPLFCHHLSTILYGVSAVDVRDFPNRVEVEIDGVDFESLRGLTQDVVEFNSTTWKVKKDAGLSLNSPIEGISVPSSLTYLGGDLTEMHKLE